MNLQLYSDELFSIQIDAYPVKHLLDDALPQHIIAESVSHQNKFAVAISDDIGKLIGFFGLCLDEQKEGHQKEVCGVITGFSLDFRHVQAGDYSHSFKQVFEFINQEIGADIGCLVIDVDVCDPWLTKTYLNAKQSNPKGAVVIKKQFLN